MNRFLIEYKLRGEEKQVFITALTNTAALRTIYQNIGRSNWIHFKLIRIKLIKG